MTAPARPTRRGRIATAVAVAGACIAAFLLGSVGLADVCWVGDHYGSCEVAP